MKRYIAISVTALLLLITVQGALAQQPAAQASTKPPYSDGPLWRWTFIRSFPEQQGNYLKNFKERTMPAIEEEKRDGVIADFKILINTKKVDPQDWDIVLGYKFKDQSHYEAFLRRNDEYENKAVGGPEGRKVTATQREKMKENLRTIFVKEVTLE